jgi:hypothetical protein
MKTPDQMLNWMDRKIRSANTWLETFGRGTKKQRPELDIEHREEDIECFAELRGAYVKALERRQSQGGAA